MELDLKTESGLATLMTLARHPTAGTVQVLRNPRAHVVEPDEHPAGASTAW